MKKQYGIVFIALLILIMIAALTAFLGVANSATQKNENDQATALALAQAKQALIGIAVADNNRPGSLTCPDVDNDGDADGPFGECVAFVGRLPYHTLMLPDLRDAHGERLWYVLSLAFRDANSAEPINSTTPGQLTITGAVSANNVIAIIFSPGKPFGDQVRDPANQNLVANYLEAENANGDDIYVNNMTTALFNDQSIIITHNDLFPLVEQRIAREVRNRLNAYYDANGYYPYASAFGDDDFKCSFGLIRGRLPKPYAPYTIDPDCGGLANWIGVQQQLPAWFIDNEWELLTYYTLAPSYTYDYVINSIGTAGHITVNNTPLPFDNKRALVVIAGQALGSQTRPCTGVADCLEGSENIDSDDVYEKQALSTTFNDQLTIVAP